MRRPLLLATAGIAVALALAGCSAGASSGSVAQQTAPIPKSGAVAGGSSAGDAATSQADRSVVVTGDAVISVSDPLAAATDATRIVGDAGGRVDGRSEQAGAGGAAASATLTLRIPAAKLDATLDRLRALGRVDRVSTSTADVTGQTQDLNARITALRTTISRMLDLEQRATDTTDLVAIETAIGDRQGQLESLEAQQRDLADQVAMSTITLTLQPRGTTVPPSKAGFGDGLATGWSGFVAFWGGALVVLGVLLPWLGMVAALAAVAGAVVWLVRRRRPRPASPGVSPPPVSSTRG
jgi:hypothetical protein